MGINEQEGGRYNIDRLVIHVEVRLNPQPKDMERLASR